MMADYYYFSLVRRMQPLGYGVDEAECFFVVHESAWGNVVVIWVCLEAPRSCFILLKATG